MIAALASIVPAWTKWLNEQQVDEEKRDVAEPKPGELAAPSTLVRYRPTSIKHLLQGFGTTFVYLALIDLLVARKAVDATSRFFILHTLANLAITISCAPDAFRSLSRPLDEPYGKMSILPVYLIAGLFAYHLSFFKNVPREEWVHHILFGGGIGGVGLANPASPIGNAIAFFICGLPGGIDYAMLAAVKEGLLASDTEKVLNTRLNVWLRSPGAVTAAYAIYIQMRHLPKPRPIPSGAAMLVASLTVLNGQYYMQKVVANTSVKVAPPGC